MPVNDTTTNQGYQKPNIANTLSDDVGRLRSALDSIDTDVAARLPKSGGTMTGSLTAPAFIPSGSTVPTNGVYLPSANTVAVATNSTGKLFVASGGNVGIGISSPQTLFGLASPSSISWGTSNYPYINGDQSSNFIAFGTQATERLRVTSDGKVGVGTSSPLGTLSVGNQANAIGQVNDIFIAGDKVNADGYFGRLLFRNSNQSGGSTASVRGERSTDNFGTALTFYTQATGSAGDGNERLRISPSGNVGIGTTAPGAALEVNAAASTAPFIAKINTSEAARIDSSGRLLVGTSSDSGGALFQVNGDRIRVGTSKTPASATATGTAGEVCWDASYIYVCTATDTWKRAALSTW